MVSTIASLYFSSLAWGCFVLLPVVSLQEVGQGFYRFFGFTCVGLQTLALGMAFWSGDGIFDQAYLVWSGFFLFFLLCYTVGLKMRMPWLRRSFFVTAVFTGFLITCLLPWKPDTAGSEFKILHSLSSSLVLGFVSLAMMLGHWYLVIPKLSIAPLKRYAAGYILLSLWKALELGCVWICLSSYWSLVSENAVFLQRQDLIFVIFRVTWGLVVPLGLSYWIWTTVKMRSTQSATGILYAAMVCTMMGEGMGLYLTLRTGVPF